MAETELKRKRNKRKMKKVTKACLVLMAILTAAYIVAVVYANAYSGDNADPSNSGKQPSDYGIWRTYFGEKLETQPQEWNTTTELGITFGKLMESAENETYELLIEDPEKALPWMNGSVPEPYAVKYGDNNFYHIVYLWATPGLPENIKSWQIPIGVALGVSWAFTGVLFLNWRKTVKNEKER
jgi:hypothetical protein